MTNDISSMKRILIIGASGSGKSTLAKRLSQRLQLPFFPSDGFYWGSNWSHIPTDKVRQQVLSVISQDAWVLDGNFDNEHESVWKQADCIIWLDYPLRSILKQVAARNLRWTLNRQQVWSGNTMTLKRTISGIRHTIKSYPLKREKYPLWLAQLERVPVYRFRSRKETEAWLQGLER